MRLEDLPFGAREQIAAELLRRMHDDKSGGLNSEKQNKQKEDNEVGFKKLRGVNRPYREQGLIRFTCLNYEKQPKAVQEKIRRLCKECGGEHEEALFVLMTRENISVPWLERTYYVSDSVLYERRKRFYEKW